MQEWAARQAAAKAAEESSVSGQQSEVDVEAEEEEKIPFSIMTSTDGEKYVEVDRERAKEFDADDGRSHAQIISEIIKDDFGGKIEANGQNVFVNATTNNEWRNSKNAQWLIENEQEVYKDKLKSFAHADELLTAASDWINEKKKHIRNDNFVQFSRGKVNYKVGGNGYSADAVVGITKSRNAVLYDIVNINKKAIAAENATASEETHETMGTTSESEPSVEKTDEFHEGNVSHSLKDVKSDVAEEATTPSAASRQLPHLIRQRRSRCHRLG